jgi:hypothetical protein
MPLEATPLPKEDHPMLSYSISVWVHTIYEFAMTARHDTEQNGFWSEISQHA